MSTIAWRRFLLTLCAFGVVQLGYVTWLGVNQGAVSGGLRAVPSGTPFVRRVMVARGSAAYDAGLRTGDLIDGRRLSGAERYRLFNSWFLSGAIVQLPVRHRGVLKAVTLELHSKPGGFDSYIGVYSVWVAIAALLWTLIFAALVAWRRSEIAEARILSLVLALNVIGINFQNNNWLTPWPSLDAALACLAWIFGYGSIALFVLYTMGFARPPSRARQVVSWLAYASTAVGACYGILAAVGAWSGTLDQALPWYSGWGAAILRGILPELLALLCAFMAIAQARGAEQARVTWASASLGFWYALGIFSTAAGAVAPNSATVYQAAAILVNVGSFIVPLGLTYSLLYRRLLDISFAVNRAAVFSIVSIIVVGAFVLVEWLLGGWLHDASHATNVAVSAALALALGFSVRFVHARVDGFVDNVFFRKRHENEQAIRKLAREAPYITDAKTLLDRTVSTLELHAGASSVTVLLDDGNGRYGDYDENDPALVELRTFHEPLDLHGAEGTVISGELAYPMASRGRLIGALVLGPKVTGESYAPDESDAVAQLAHAVGVALDALGTGSGESHDLMLDGIRAVLSGLQSVSQKLDGLSDAMAPRSRESA